MKEVSKINYLNMNQLSLIRFHFPLNSVFRRAKDKEGLHMLLKKQFKFIIKQESEIYKILQNIFTRYKKFRLEHKTMDSITFIFRALDKIITDDYFGCKSNRKRFYLIVKKITRRSIGEYIYTSELHEGFDISKMPWINRNEDNKNSIIEVNMWILNHVVKQLINHYFYPMKDLQTNYGLISIPKKKWISFQCKILHNMIKKGHLKPIKSTPIEIRGRLKIIMKNNIADSTNYRPIILFNNKSINKSDLKKRSANIRRIANQISVVKTGCFFQHWTEFIKKSSTKRIYGAKIDIKDAFGSIDYGRIDDVLNNLTKIRKITKENANFIHNYIKNQYIVYQYSKNGTPRIGKWNHGVLQGDPLSSALCQLYLSVLDRQNLQSFIQDKESILHRTVDDYIYCSTNKANVDRFVDVMLKTYNVNKNKLKSNLNVNCPIIYCGNLLLLDSKEVKYSYEFKKGSTIKDRCKLWNEKQKIDQDKPELFISRILMFQWNKFHFDQLFINSFINGEQTILDNFFEGMIFLAFKLDAAVMAVYSYRMKLQFLETIINNIIKEYSNRSAKILKKQGGDSGINWYKHFLKVGYRAFQLVLKKRNKLYNEVLRDINKSWNFPSNTKFQLNKYRKLPEAFSNLKIGSCIG